MHTQYILAFDAIIPTLEERHEWYLAAQYLFNSWKQNPNNLNNFLCAGTQAWYGILSIDYDRMDPNIVVDTKKLEDEEDRLYIMLTELTRWGFLHFAQNAVFNAYFGYMMKVMPYYFLDFNGDYDGWKKKGIAMMRQSFLLEPANPLARVMYYEADAYTADTAYLDACRDFWNCTDPADWGRTAVSSYFYNIFYGNVFLPEMEHP